MLPEDYEAWYATGRGQWIGELEFRLIRDLLGAREGERVLDVGCGTGWFTRRFSRSGELQVMGVDQDRNVLGLARRRDPSAAYLQADARHLPFGDGQFERVLSIAALCFLPDWELAFAEILRVCRSRFAVGLLNRHSLLWLEKGRSRQGGYQGAHWHTHREILDFLAGQPVAGVRMRTAVLLPGGSRTARFVEPFLGRRCQCSWGSFLAVSGEVSRTGNGRPVEPADPLDPP